MATQAWLPGTSDEQLETILQKIGNLNELLISCRIPALLEEADHILSLLSRSSMDVWNINKLKVNTLYFISKAYHWLGLFSKELQTGEEMKQIASNFPDEENEIGALIVLGKSTRELGHYEKADGEYLEPALIKCRKLDNRLLLFECLIEAAAAKRALRCDRESVDLCQEAESISKQIGDYNLMADALYQSGISLRVSSRINQAQEEFSLACEYYENTGNTRGIGKSLRQLTINMPQEEAADRSAFIEKAFRFADANNDKYEIAECYILEGLEIIAENEGKQSLEYFKDAESIYREVGDIIGLEKVYFDMGVVYFWNNKLDKARSYYNKSLEISEKLNNYAEMADYHLYLGELDFAEERYDIALTHYNRAAELYLRPGKGRKLDIANSALHIGSAESMLENYESALGYYKTAMQVYEEKNELAQLAAVYCDTGSVYTHLEDAREAQRYFNRALELEKELGNAEGQIKVLDNLVIFCFNNGSYDEAINYLNVLTKLNLSLQNFDELASNYRDMGNAYYNLENYTKAIFSYSLAVEVLNKMDKAEEAVEILLDIGETYYIIDDYQNALKFLNGAFHFNNKAVKPPSMARNLRDLGNVYYAMDNYKEARSYYTYATTHLEGELDQEKQEMLAETLSRLGSCLCYLGDDESAYAHYELAIGEYQELGNDRAVAYNSWKLADIYSRYSNTLERALECYDVARNYYIGQDEPEMLADIYEEMGELHLELQDYSKAYNFFYMAQNNYKKTNDHEGASRVKDQMDDLSQR